VHLCLKSRTGILVTFALASAASAFAAESTNRISSQQVSRGKLLYLQHCVICHQASGQGAAGTFPPLAKSDFLMADKERSIRALVEGLSGPITVNGRNYDGAMPPVVLNDAQVADVLTFVRTTFGNNGDAVTVAEAKQVRSTSRFRTYEALLKASAYPPLPKAPPGFSVREVARLPAHGTRLATEPNALLVLGERGDIWRVEPKNGQITQLLPGNSYCAPNRAHLG